MTSAARPVRVFGVVPAAGQSRRMGQPKQLMPVDGRPMLLVVIDSLLGGGIDGLAVVTGSDLVARLNLTQRADLQTVVNDDAASAMIDSVLMGIESLESAHGLRPADGLLVLPADHPGVGADLIRACADAYRAQPQRLIVATYRAQRGHPLVFPFEFVPELRQLAHTGGLNQLLDTRRDRLVELDCRHAGVVGDLDTLDDYRQLGEPPPARRPEEPE